jgi:hypothetical protein
VVDGIDPVCQLGPNAAGAWSAKTQPANKTVCSEEGSMPG